MAENSLATSGIFGGAPVVAAAPVGPVDPSAGYALYLPFSAASPTYRVGATTYTDPTLLPGYTYTRSGAKSELNASGSPIAFAANVAGIVPGVGYWSRGALTNETTNSQDLATGWVVSGGTVTANTGVAPDGTTTMDRVTLGAATTYPYINPNNFLSVNAQSYTFSIFVKAGTLGFMQILGDNAQFGATQYANYNLATGAVTATGAGASAYTVNCGGGIWRLVYVVTASAAATAPFFVAFSNSGTLGRGAAWAYNGETVEMWQGELLKGNHPAGGPIIPTVATTLSIGADVFTQTVAKPLGAFVIYGKVVLGAGKTADAYIFDWTDGTASNRIAAKINASNQVAFAVVNATVNTPITGEGGVPATSRTVTWALRFNGSTWRGFAQGAVLGVESAAAAIPAGTTFNDGHSLGTNQLDDVTTDTRIIEGAQNDAAVIALMAAL